MAQDETSAAIAAMASAPKQAQAKALANGSNKKSKTSAGDAEAAPAGQAGPVAPKKPEKELYPMSNWKYDTFLWTMSVLVDLFFREVHPRGSWKVPRSGPVLIVAAPHANQFVDALVLLRTFQLEAKRRVSLLIAQKSIHGFIGWASRQVGCVPVGRAQDSAKPATGTIFLPDPIGDPTLLHGNGTDFEKQAEVNGMVFLPSVKGQSGSSVDIAEIISPTALRLKRPFQGKVSLAQLTGHADELDAEGNFHDRDAIKGPAAGYEGTKFKLAPHIDQTKVYHAVFDRLSKGGCVGIFPEGGSHDRPGLLPLKAGVAIMALGTLEEAPDCGLKIMPVGMNYFHAHKFRSRAVVEFGQAFEVPPELVALYKQGKRRDAIAQVLDMVHQALAAVTVSTPDYDTLMLISAARRLYNPTGKKLPLPVVVELNRRLALGYEKYKDDARLRKVTAAVRDYNKELRYLNIRDHQVNYARLPWWKCTILFFVRLVQLVVLSVAVVPGLVLFSPVFIASKVISRRKAAEALAGSSVKIQGRDVMATWKLLVAMALAPILYNFYCVLFVLKFGSDRLWGYVPEWATKAPWWLVFLTGWIVFPAITFMALRFGEVGMDIFKSLRPLLLCMNPASSSYLQGLRERRASLQEQVTELINLFGPDMFPDFADKRLDKNTVAAGAVSSPTTEPSSPTSPQGPPSPIARTSTGGSPKRLRRQRTGSDFSDGNIETPTAGILGQALTRSGRAVPRNESFSNIGTVGMFATRPPSRSRSRSRSGSRSSSRSGTFGNGGISGFTTLDSKEGFDEASKKIREAMRERGELRRRQSSRKDFTLADEDDEDDYELDSDDEKKNI